MTVRTAYVGTQAVGDVLTSANFTKLPGGWIGYVEVTANQGSITTEVDLTSLTLTVTVGSSRRLRIMGSMMFSSTVASDTAQCNLYDTTSGSTKLSQSLVGLVSAGQGASTTVHCIITPASGSRSYKLTGRRGAGTGTLTMLAASDVPAFLMIQDIGPAS